jgi:ribosomal-protein-alanine N-acetyltransferase
MQLETPRLILRDFVIEDLEALTAYQSDPRYRSFYGPDEHSPEQPRKLLEMFIANASESPRQNYQLAIVHPPTSPDPIGNCGVRCRGMDTGFAEFGLELAPHTWGRGFATEAGSAILGFGFRELGIHTVLATTVRENERVTRLALKLGFRAVGTNPGPEWMQTRGWSQTQWELTSSDWSSRE